MAFTKPDVNYVWASTGGVVEPVSAKIQLGWVAEIPDFEFENWIQNRQDQFNAHINQYGIPVWDAITEYQAGKSYVQGSDGIVYKAITTSVGSDPVSSPSDWQVAFDGAGTSYTKAQADDRFLNSTSNLSDLTNTNTARTNLSVYSKGEGDARYLQGNNNLSELGDASVARTNLNVYAKTDVYTKTEGDARYLRIANNLSDLTNTGSARSALSVYSKSESDGRYLQISNNLSDLGNLTTARTNLDVYSKGEGDTRYMRGANNLAELTNTSSARSKLNVYSKSESDSRYLQSASLNWGVGVFTTAYLNNYDEVINYTLPVGYVMVGLYSVHNNSTEDRRWKIRYRQVFVSAS